MSARDRLNALAAMKAGSIKGVLGTGTSIYGIYIDTMSEGELRIALGWALSQCARLDPANIGIQKEPRQ